MSLSMYSENDEEASRAAGVPLYYGFLEATVIGMWCLLSWQLGWTYAPRCPPTAEDEGGGGSRMGGIVGFLRYLVFGVVLPNHQPAGGGLEGGQPPDLAQALSEVVPEEPKG